jgi:tetratricopeptide (TPR) repeat protein
LAVSICDSQGHPLAGASAQLRLQGETKSQSVHVDVHGRYDFTGLHPGTYTLQAEMAGYGDISYGPFTLQAGEGKRVTLTLPPSGASSKASTSLQFSDEPQFTIAGIKDPTNFGGHGSNATAPAEDELARKVASLPGPVPALAPMSAGAERALRQAADRQPVDFDANHRLGKLLLDQRRPREALAYLQRASQLKPADYQNNYELALAYRSTAQYDQARATLRAMLANRDDAKLHNLLAEVEEARGESLQAAREYERAAQLEPSEANLFDWGAELLRHRATEPAVEVFGKGHRLFPDSIRMAIGLGVSWLVQGSYDRAVRYLCHASDLDPGNPQPYLFLGKIQEVEPISLAGVSERLARFVRLRPRDAQAKYYYALSLWKRPQSRSDASHAAQVSSLLQEATHLDRGYAAAYLLLGVVQAEQQNYTEALFSYKKAIAADPALAEAHYRLAQSYVRSGDQIKARAEIQIYQQLAKEKVRRAESERDRMQQFVYTLRGSKSAAARPR